MSDEQKKTILVIEDEASLRKILVERFGLEGFNVLQAKDGEEGLKVALKQHPDIILLDIVMPKMDGNAMFKKLLRDRWGIAVPVIMLSNLSDSQTIVGNVKVGVSDYLVKSEYKIDDIVKKVKERLNYDI